MLQLLLLHPLQRRYLVLRALHLLCFCHLSLLCRQLLRRQLLMGRADSRLLLGLHRRLCLQLGLLLGLLLLGLLLGIYLLQQLLLLRSLDLRL